MTYFRRFAKRNRGNPANFLLMSVANCTGEHSSPQPPLQWPGERIIRRRGLTDASAAIDARWQSHEVSLAYSAFRGPINSSAGPRPKVRSCPDSNKSGSSAASSLTKDVALPNGDATYAHNRGQKDPPTPASPTFNVGNCPFCDILEGRPRSRTPRQNSVTGKMPFDQGCCMTGAFTH